jgi:ELWxxDGT repeat protein
MKKKLPLLFMLLTFCIHAQEQITSFVSQDGDKSSYPSGFIQFNNLFYFTATTEGYGRELWVTNGDENNAVLLKDIYPGVNSSKVGSAIVFNNAFYFIATDGKSAGELWKSDGTTIGTQKITDFLDADIKNLTVVGNQLFFLSKSNSTSWLLWKSNGTASGTTLVREVLAWNTPTYEGELNGLFVFTIEPPSTNVSRIWRSDGSDQGTFPLIDASGNGAGPGGTTSLTQYINFNNELYFVIRSNPIFGSNSVGIMKTDGTLANTVAVQGVHNGSEAGGTSGVIKHTSQIVINDKIYFSFYQDDFNRLFIWETTGTLASTQKIYDETFTEFFIPSNLSKSDDSLLFLSGNSTGGESLISIDVNTLAVTEIKELATEIVELPDHLISRNIATIKQIAPNNFFISLLIDYSSSSGIKGWISDLTTSGTSNFSALDGVRNVQVFNNLMYFSKFTTSEGVELWRSDSTQANTLLIDNINTSKYGLFSSIVPSTLNKRLIFHANDGITGDELWTYDNNTANLSLLKDINNGGVFNSFSRKFTQYNGDLFFTAYNNTSIKLWKTDGSTTGTTIANEVSPGISSSNPEFITIHNNELYFIALLNDHYYLFKKEGNNAIPVLDLDLHNNQFGSILIEQLVSSGNYFYFSTSSGAFWRSDGTESGTILLKDFIDVGKAIDVNGTLYFTATASEHINEYELYKSNGAAGGTVLVKDIETGFSSDPNHLINNNGILFFSAETTTMGREIWRSDGTENGTYQIADINVGTNGSIRNDLPYHLRLQSDNDLALLGNELFFSANNGIDGFELWKTDGTESGTTMVSDINLGEYDSNPSEIVSVDNFLYFQAYNFVNGAELWKSDGSEQGTTLVSDILSGSISSSPSDLITIDNDLFFTAETSTNGRQIWKIQGEVVLSTPDISSNELISMYPNPSHDYVHIQTNSHVNEISIYSLNGHLINKINAIENNTFNIAGLSSGVYLIAYEIEGRKSIKKLIKI